MITHSIRTSKYKTTIDIPAQKLQTKSKFIQISKGPVPQQQTIIIPNPCCQHDRQKLQMNLQTKLVIQELQKAYNEDMMVYEQKLKKLQTQGQIQRLKLQNLIQYQKRQIEIYKLNSSQSQQKINKLTINYSNQINSLQNQIKNNQNQLFSRKSKIEQLQSQVKQLSLQNLQKSQLLSSRFNQLEVERERIYRQEKNVFMSKLDNFRRQNQTINQQLQRSRNSNNNLQSKIRSLQRQYQTLKAQQAKLRQLNQFQTEQIQGFIKNIKDLQSDKQRLITQNMILQKQIKQQNISIDQLIEEMRVQKEFIQNMQSNNNNHDQQSRIFSQKLGDYQTIFAQKQQQLIEHKSLYLLKLEELDKQRQKSKTLQSENHKLQQEIHAYTVQITKISKQRDDIGKLLTTKTLQYNQLLSKPPEQKVYEVKIQKTIQKKQYIEQLEQKVSVLEKMIEKLKEENQTIVEEIQKSVLAERQGKRRQKILQSSIEQLKSYIATNQNRIAWSVSRQIAKDIQINKQSSQKSSGYKVFIKQHQSSSSHSQQVSDIKNEKNGLNFSVQQKLEHILNQKEVSSLLNKSKQNDE